MKSVLFIFDDNKKFGNGHFQRCQKFKKIFTNDYQIRFIQSDKLNFFNKNKKTFDYIVLDSYKTNYLQEIKLKKFCNKLITIDDLYNRKFACDYLINYSPIIKKKNYKKKISKNTKLLLGSRFNFISENIQSNKIKPKKKFTLFFYLGQKNRINIIKNLISSIKDKNKIKKIFIFGNKKKIIPHKQFLNKMNCSDILILSSGVSLQEGLSRKKVIFSKYFSKNQKTFFQYYKNKNYIKNISEFKNFINQSVEKINNFILKKDNFFFSLSESNLMFNIRSNILPLSDDRKNIIKIKSYTNNYIKNIYKLQTRENRKYFKNKKLFSFNQHQDYLKRFLSYNKNSIYVITIKNNFAGYVKLESKKNKLFVSILIDKDFRNRKIASRVLYYFKDNNIFGKKLFAEINKYNLSSINAFKNAKFFKSELKLF